MAAQSDPTVSGDLSDQIESQYTMLPTFDSQMSHTTQIDYWTAQSADVNGMLGGYPQVSRIDLQGSKNFIAKIRRLSRPSSSTPTTASTQSSSSPPPTTTTKSKPAKVKLVVDVGAGIGRITSGLLLQIAETVDIVEPVKKFTDVLAKLEPASGQGQIGQIHNVGLEGWVPEAGRKYDLIWIQWCLGHLTDRQVVAMLQRVMPCLATREDGKSGQNGAGVEGGEPEGKEQRAEGWIMIKENLSSDVYGGDIFDEDDSSVTRSDEKFKQLFEEAGCKVIKMEVQSGFPKSLYPVKMYALRPK